MSGKLITETDETKDACFFDLKELPNIPNRHRETLADLVKYEKTNGPFILK
jgi:hypothetical protein